MLIKKFNILQDKRYTLEILVFRNKKFLILKRFNDNKSNYLLIPQTIKIEKKNSSLFFSTEKKNLITILENFYNSFNFFLKNNQKIFYKKLLLKGLGFRLAIFKRPNINYSRILRLKVGFSHFVYISIPPQLLVSTNKKKNVLNIKSDNVNSLGTFCSSLKRIKKINVYNGKGFWYKKEKKTLKVFKKK
jgi:ribosomal protein L6P/L9E